MGVPRRITQLAAAAEGESPGLTMVVLFALADDGTTWRYEHGMKGWRQVEPDGLPEAESCGLKHRDDDRAVCRLAKGHRDQHWSGVRRWT